MVSDGEANEPENNELQLNEHPDINLENPEDPGGEYCLYNRFYIRDFSSAID